METTGIIGIIWVMILGLYRVTGKKKMETTIMGLYRL